MYRVHTSTYRHRTVSTLLGTMTITLDFLKSSSRGGPRVPRPLLLVKVTVAAAPRAAPLASRPKFTRYSFLHSRLLKKVTRTPLFGPPFFRLSASTWTRDNSFIARPLTPPARGIPCAPCLLRPPSTSPAGSQLPRVSTCTHGTVLSGPALRVLKVRVLCRPFALSGPRAILFGTIQARGRGSAGKWSAICSCHSRYGVFIGEEVSFP